MKRSRYLAGFVLLGTATWFGACATVQGPSGGPEDRTPPELVAAWPDSGSVGLAGLRRLSFRFSEKMDPQPASTFLQLYPEIPLARTKWKGRRDVAVTLAAPLPPDTVIVVEIGRGMRDAHRVPSMRSYAYPLATADSLPGGAISGQLFLQEDPAADGMVELFAVPPETLAYYQQSPLRRAQADSLGRWHLRWLPWPSGPYLIRAFADANGDQRAGDNEARRLLPEPVRLDSLNIQRDLGVTLLYDPRTPGRLIGTLTSPSNWPGRLMGWTEKIAEEDTGWAPSRQSRSPPGLRVLPADQDIVFEQVGPGLVRMILFVDADHDSVLSLLPAGAGTQQDGPWFWEPFSLLDSLHVEAGLDTTFTPAAFSTRLTPWSEPKDEP